MGISMPSGSRTRQRQNGRIFFFLLFRVVVRSCSGSGVGNVKQNEKIRN